MNYFQELRQRHIMARLKLFGRIDRKSLVERFNIGLATATRDLRYYKKHNGNIEYDVTNKNYILKITKNNKGIKP